MIDDPRKVFHELRNRLHRALPRAEHRNVDAVLSDFAIELGLTTRTEVAMSLAMGSILTRGAATEEPDDAEWVADDERADDTEEPEGGWLEPDPEIAAEFERRYR